MAQQISVVTLCDIDMEPGQVEKTRFTWYGRTYELELCHKHRSELDEIMGNLVARAKELRALKPVNRSAVARRKSGALRTWALNDWYWHDKVRPGGRFPEQCVKDYETCNGETRQKPRGSGSA